MKPISLSDFIAHATWSAAAFVLLLPILSFILGYVLGSPPRKRARFNGHRWKYRS